MFPVEIKLVCLPKFDQNLYNSSYTNSSN